VLKEGTDPRYGAHCLKRGIETLVVQPPANLIATHQIGEGDSMRVSHREGATFLPFFLEAETSAGWAVAEPAAA